MHRFSDNYGWFPENRPVLPIACVYAAIARKIPPTVLISMHSYLVRSLRDSFQPLSGACVVEQESLRDLTIDLITGSFVAIVRARAACVTMVTCPFTKFT